MKKNEVRKLLLEKRKNLSKQEFDSMNEQIIQHSILFLDSIQPKNVHCFLPIITQKEINTYPILEQCLKKNISVILSKSDFSNLEMTSYLIEKETVLSGSAYGIPEPIDALEFNDKEIEFIFTPLIACDKQGNRVGYGKGFYDRFFSKCNSNVLKVGLSIFEPIEIIQDVNKMDVKLDYCITPNGIIRFD